jgi:hypothetical protein
MATPSFAKEDDYENEYEIGSISPTASINIYIRCRTCGSQNCFKEITPHRTDLAIFRGSENPIIKCKSCHADIDTMTAFCGERVGSEIVRRNDPKS